MEAKSKIFSSRGKVIATALIGLLIGFGLCHLYYEPKVKTLDTQLSDTLENLSTTKEKIAELQSELTKLQTERSRLEDLTSSLNSSLSETMQKLSDKERELKKVLDELSFTRKQLLLMNETIAIKEKKIAVLNDTISAMENKMEKIGEAVSKLENDRKLLVYLRMEPESREEAFQYWQTVKKVSVTSDARLGPLVDKIISYIDVYYDWLDKRPGPEASKEEIANWLFDLYFSPAVQYLLAIDEFTKEAYLTLITHIELATELIS